ncbi:MAG: DsbA family protein [Capsulimonadaceae bacterium]
MRTLSAVWRRNVRGGILRAAMRPVAVGLLVLGLCPVFPAQAKDDKHVDDEITALKAQVAQLMQQQQQILDQMNQIKFLLQASAQAAPAPAPAPPPTPAMPSTLAVQGLPIEGSSSARIVMVEFTDFECPFCGRYANNIYPQIYNSYIKTGKIRYIYQDDPLPFHPQAMPAAIAVHCAEEQGKFWEMHDSLFANQAQLQPKDFTDRAQSLGLNITQFSQCVASQKYADEIQKGITAASGAGVKGTPMFFIGTLSPDGSSVSVDNEVVGAEPFAKFQTELDAELAPKA